MRLLFLSTIFFFFASCPLWAQSDSAEANSPDEANVAGMGDTNAIKNIPLLPVLVHSVRASNNAPFAKTEISKEEIARQNLGQDLPVLLQLTPSAVVNTDAGAGVGYTGIRIRGTDPARINVTLNGIPVNDPEEQGAFFVDFPDVASSTNSIQIQRGVGSSTNGTGAFGATISINNNTVSEVAGASISSSAGSFNTFKNTLQASTGRMANKLALDVRLSQITSDGYIERSASRLQSLQVNADYSISSNTSLKFMMMQGKEKTGQAWNGVYQDSLNTNRRYNELGQKPDSSFYNNQTDNYIQNYYQLFLDHKFSNTLSAHGALFLTRGKGYYEEYKQGELYADYGIANPISPKGDTQFATDLTRQLWLDNYYYGGLFSMLYSKNKLKINLGGAFTQFENLGYGYVLWAQQGGIANNYQWYRHDAQKNDFNTYIKLNYALTGIDFYGEMQYRTIAYFMNGFRKNPSLKHVVNYDFYNPKAGFSLRIGNQWVVKQKLYASIAVAHREPNRATFETNATLPKPEQLTDYEAGYEVKSNKASLAVNGYYMNYRNQLVLTGQINDVGAYTQTNVKESYRSGIEVEASVQLAKWWQTGGNITLSANKIKNFTEYIDNYDSTAQRVNTYSLTDIAFSPSIIGCFTNRFSVEGKKHNRLELDVSLKHVGSQYLDNTSNSQRKIGDYTYTNLLLKYAIHPRSMQQISASLQMNNLFGSLYANNGYTSSSIADRQLTTANYYYPQAGINFLAGLQLVW